MDQQRLSSHFVDPAPKPFFPLDLEREIFETAAQRHSGIVPTLLRVCHRVHIWIEPLLYRTLTIDHEHKSRILLAVNLAIETKPRGFLATAVRHVFLWYERNRMSRDIDFLLHCSGITNLCIAGDFDPDLIPVMTSMRLQKLAVNAPFPPSVRLNHPLFMPVTHLDVNKSNSGPAETWESWPPCPRLRTCA
ncbi:hypothetical protein DFH09DRAFT_404865 [Mycena vulgaris]|nr:hypothetical protein DFH09DRAFT_404865 [Mycena vulgaris]